MSPSGRRRYLRCADLIICISYSVQLLLPHDMPYLYDNEGPMSSSSETVGASFQTREPKKLILCFDGTGNTFSGSNADTNVVKILNKLDRNDPNQHHYYQRKCSLQSVK